MKYYPPSIFNAFNICKRQAWLMSRQLTADQHNEFIEIGRLIDEETYKRERKKIYLADLEAMMDMVVKKDGVYYVAEIKKSTRTLKSGIFQLKYYLFLLKRRKGLDVKGIIKIPKEKISEKIILSKQDEEKIVQISRDMEEVLKQPKPPTQEKMLKICPKCGHFEFCWG